MKFAFPACLWIVLALAAGSLALSAFSKRIAISKLGKFCPAERLPKVLATVDFHAKTKKYWMLVGALGLLVIAMARPLFGPRPGNATMTGAEFFIILDVSKSMLVRDVSPNRLEAIKASLSKWLKTRQGDRIGLILMAGDSFVQAPLTRDFTALREVLEQSGPRSVSLGGSNIPAAIEVAAEAMAKSGLGEKAVVLITDGENLTGDVMAAVARARQSGELTIFTVGVGTPEGGPVPELPKVGVAEDFSKPPEQFVRDEYGTQATSRLDERNLRSLAAAGGGHYFPFASDDGIWDALYTQFLRPMGQHGTNTSFRDYDELFQIPALAALLILAWEMVVSTRVRNLGRPRSVVILPDPSPLSVVRRLDTKAKAALAGVLALSIGGTVVSVAAEPPTLREAERMIHNGQARETAEALWAASQQNPGDSYSLFNYGVAAYSAGDYQGAINAFSAVAGGSNAKLRGLALTHLGNAQFRLGESLEKSKNADGTILSWERAVEYYESNLRETQDGEARHNLGIVKGKLEQTLVAYGSQLMEVGAKLKRNDVLAQAVDQFEKAVALNPSNQDAASKLVDAKKLLTESLLQNARAMREKADAQEKEQEKDRYDKLAKDEYEKAAQAAPQNADIAREQEEFKKEVGGEMASRAEKNIKDALNATPKNPNDKMGNLLEKQKLLSSALQQTEKALAFDAESVRARQLNEQAKGELEKAHVERGDLLKERADASKPVQAIGQYWSALKEFKQAQELKPNDAGLESNIDETQEKLAKQLTAAGKELDDVATKTANGEPAGPKKTATPAQEPPKPAERLQEAIGVLEKAASYFQQAEALAPGKTDAADQREKTNERLEGLRKELDKELAAQGGETGADPGNQAKAEAPEGSPAPAPSPSTKTDFSQIASKGFGEIRQGTQGQGEFADKTEKKRIRDW